MNERIQDLIKQSGGHWNRDLTMDHHGNFITSHSVKFQKDDIEKFAELIVRECAKQCLSDDSMRILNHMGVKGVEE